MEGLTIVLSAILSLLSPAGLILDGLSETAIRDRFESVEQLRVRIDNAPTHQIFQGRVDRVSIAGRGLTLKPIPLRIALLEVETDPIDLDLQNLENGLPKALQEPLQAGIRIVLTEDDLNRSLLSSPDPNPAELEIGNYTLLHPQIDFLEDNRLRLQVEVREGDDPQTANVVVESGFEVRGGRLIALVAPVVQANEETVPPQLLDAIFGGIDRVVDLDRLTPPGTILRLLQLRLTPDRLEVAAFVRIEQKKPDE
jgi:LmeA-like phospholipid-binding